MFVSLWRALVLLQCCCATHFADKHDGHWFACVDGLRTSTHVCDSPDKTSQHGMHFAPCCMLSCSHPGVQERRSGLILQWQLWKADISRQSALVHTALLSLYAPVSRWHCTAALQDLFTSLVSHPWDGQIRLDRLRNRRTYQAGHSLAASSRKQVTWGPCPTPTSQQARSTICCSAQG